MPELTCMRFGYRGFREKFRRSALDSWDVEWPEWSENNRSFREACFATAAGLAKQKNITLLYSGGIDSEVALLSLLEVGIRPRVCTIRLEGSLNQHDLFWVEEFRRRYGVPIEFIDLNLNQLFDSGEALRIARTYQASHLEFCVSLAAMEKLDDQFIILGSGEPYLIRRKESPKGAPNWYLCERENAYCWSKFLQKSPGGGSRFFQASSLILSAFLYNKQTQLVLSGDDFGKASSLTLKQQIFQASFGVSRRPKFTGFEHAQLLCREFQYIVRREVGSFSALALQTLPQTENFGRQFA